MAAMLSRSLRKVEVHLKPNTPLSEEKRTKSPALLRPRDHTGGRETPSSLPGRREKGSYVSAHAFPKTGRDVASV